LHHCGEQFKEISYRPGLYAHQQFDQFDFVNQQSSVTSSRLLTLVEWSYFAQKCNKFHLQPSTFEKISRGETPDLRLQRQGDERRKGEEVIKGFLRLKEREARGGKG